MSRHAKIKNVSRTDFYLSLDSVSRGKTFKMHPDAVVVVNDDELNYLMTECQGAFKNGYLEVVEKDEDVAVDVVETENYMSNDEIDELLNSQFNRIKSQLSKIDASHLLREIRGRAEELNKSPKVLEIIDKRIEEVSTSLVL